MSSFFIISIMTDDRPGLIETLSSLVSQHQGNWLESRMANLAGKFAGIVRVQISDEHADALQKSLEQLSTQGWSINLEKSHYKTQGKPPLTQVTVNIVGNDRPGIVKEVSQVLAGLTVNVLELATEFESAAMSAEALFKTQAQLELPQGLSLDTLTDELENLSNDLMVEIQE